MNLYFTLLLLFIALDGCFSKKIWLKRSVPITRKATKCTEVSAVTKNVSGPTVIFTNISTTEANFQHLNGSSINSIDPLANLSTPETNLQYLHVNLGNSTHPETTTYSTPNILEHSDKNVKFENAKVSGILVYAPKEDESFLEQNLIRKFQKFFISLFPKFEQNESLIVAHQNDVSEDPIKVKRQGIGDIITKVKEIKETVVDTSKIVIQDTKDAVKTVENEAKKIVARNAQTISTNIDSSTKEDTDTNVVYQFPQSSESLPTILEKDNEVVVKTQTTEKVASLDEANSSKDVISSNEVNSSKETTKRKKNETNSSNLIATRRNTDNTISKTFLGSTDDDSFKMDVREDFFKYKDWLWQHLEAARNGSLKSNSTEEFLKRHNFLLNSGGTGQSATDGLELIANVSENKSDKPQMKLYLYKSLLEELNLGRNLSLQPDSLLKRYRRIKRNFERFKRKRGNDNLSPSHTDGDRDETTLSDEEVSLPEGETATIATNKEGSTLTSLTTLSSIEIPNNISITTTSVTETTTEAKTEFAYSMYNFRRQRRMITTTEYYGPKVATLCDKPIVRLVDDGTGGAPQKPLLLIVSLPCFIGMGICILLLCYIVRPGGWCCNLFEVSTKTQETAAKEEEEKPSVSQQPQRQRIDFSKK